MKNINDYLSIVIITYNRATLLDRTLKSILTSPFKYCSITVLDNHSSDNTRRVVQNFSEHKNLKIVTNVFNIGGNANILRALEYATKKYIWILADDDTYDFSDCGDVINLICNKDLALIHVGGHKYIEWPKIQITNIEDALKNDYLYFKICSFLPANIINVDFMKDFIIAGYNNISNSYPHMPYLINVYKQKLPFFISNNKIVIAGMGAQEYTSDNLYEWWISTAIKNFASNSERELFIYSQFFKPKEKFKYIKLLWNVSKRNVSLNCIINTLLIKNIFYSLFCFSLVFIMHLFRNIIKPISFLFVK